MANINCARCGKETLADASNTSGSWKPIRLELGICDICAIGEERARAYAAGKGTRWLIIDGHMYSPSAHDTVPLGKPDPRPRTPMRGMAGRRFDFERFDGSPPVSCYSLWSGGEVDPWARDRMPDNGRFLNGATKARAGDILCFNPSRPAKASPRGTHE